MSKHKKLQSYTALFRVRTAIINLARCSNKYHKAKCSCSKFQPNIPTNVLLFFWYYDFVSSTKILKCFWIRFHLKCNNTTAPKIHCDSTTTHVPPSRGSCKQQPANLNPHFIVRDNLCHRQYYLWLSTSVKKHRNPCSRLVTGFEYGPWLARFANQDKRKFEIHFW